MNEQIEKELPKKMSFWKAFRIWHLTYRAHWNYDQKKKFDKRHKKYIGKLRELGVRI